ERGQPRHRTRPRRVREVTPTIFQRVLSRSRASTRRHSSSNRESSILSSRTIAGPDTTGRDLLPRGASVADCSRNRCLGGTGTRRGRGPASVRVPGGPEPEALGRVDQGGYRRTPDGDVEQPDDDFPGRLPPPARPRGEPFPANVAGGG